MGKTIARMEKTRKTDIISIKLTFDKMYTVLKDLKDSKPGVIDGNTIISQQEFSEWKNKFDFPLKSVADVLAFNFDIVYHEEYKKYLVSNIINNR